VGGYTGYGQGYDFGRDVDDSGGREQPEPKPTRFDVEEVTGDRLTEQNRTQNTETTWIDRRTTTIAIVAISLFPIPLRDPLSPLVAFSLLSYIPTYLSYVHT
jgi:hypothetical protein